jgi:RimJ/RimL family protein N-acetyltransferase
MRSLRTARLELRPMGEGDLDDLVELDGFEAVRTAIDPFDEHIPADPVERREYERRFLHPAGFLAAVELATGRFLGWFQLEADRDRADRDRAQRDRADRDRAQRAERQAGAVSDAGAAAGAASATAGPGGAGATAAAGAASATAGPVELGYRLRPDAWGQGFATEGAAALLDDALNRPDVTRVYAHVLLSNVGSIRVIEKIGMTYAGPWSYRGLEGAEYEAWPAETGPRSAPAKRP